eukprot:10307017-Heterocapsa_arctica.AAC.1
MDPPRDPIRNKGGSDVGALEDGVPGLRRRAERELRGTVALDDELACDVADVRLEEHDVHHDEV